MWRFDLFINFRLSENNTTRGSIKYVAGWSIWCVEYRISSRMFFICILISLPCLNLLWICWSSKAKGDFLDNEKKLTNRIEFLNPWYNYPVIQILFMFCCSTGDPRLFQFDVSLHQITHLNIWLMQMIVNKLLQDYNYFYSFCLFFCGCFTASAITTMILFSVLCDHQYVFLLLVYQ